MSTALFVAAFGAAGSLLRWALAVTNSTATLLVWGACAGGVLLGRWFAR